MNRLEIVNKLYTAYPYCCEDRQNAIAQLLMNIDERLRPNIEEWIENKPLSEIWIRGKYCVQAVMQIRQDDDFVDAILALNEYAKKSSNEYLIWRQRA